MYASNWEDDVPLSHSHHLQTHEWNPSYCIAFRSLSRQRTCCRMLLPRRSNIHVQCRMLFKAVIAKPWPPKTLATRVYCDRDITPKAPTPKTQSSIATVVTALGCRPVRVFTISILQFTVVRLGFRCASHTSSLRVLNVTRYHHSS